MARAPVVTVTPAGRIEATYNFEVEGFHTDFFGESGLWAHNACREVAELARRLGYQLDRSLGRPYGQPVFRNGRNAISRDVGGHGPGYWKMFRVFGNGRLRREGTWDRYLRARIGD